MNTQDIKFEELNKDNHKAAEFYLKHGFKKTDVMEGNDYYYLRYPG